MTNLEYLNSFKNSRDIKFSNTKLSEGDIEMRKMNALEIIAEELIKLNENLYRD